APARTTLTARARARCHRLRCWTAEVGRRDQCLARLGWLSGANGLDLRGVGPGTWQCLLNTGALAGMLDWLDTRALPPTCGNQLAGLLQPATERGFLQWLRALSMPPSGDAVLPEQWTVLPASTQQDWETQHGIGPHRARQLVAFFNHPQVESLRARLAAAGVHGFAVSG